MQGGSVDTFEELFTYACPKFVSPNPPDWTSATANTNADAFRVSGGSRLSPLRVPCVPPCKAHPPSAGPH